MNSPDSRHPVWLKSSVVPPLSVGLKVKALHVQEPRDWDQIALLYRQLEQLTGSPIVTVNRAVALAEIEGPADALALLDDLDLDSHLYFHSARGDFLRRLGRNDEASAAYARASNWPRPSPSAGSSSYG